MQLIYEQKGAEVRFSCIKNLSPIKHLHKQAEMVVQLEGESVCYIDETPYVLRAGDAFLAFPNQVHSYYSASPMLGALVIFRPSHCAEYAELLCRRVSADPVAHGFVTPFLRQMIDTVMQAPKEDGTRAVMARGAIAFLLSRYFSLVSLQDENPIGAEALQSILNYCMHHYASDLSLDILAKELHLSKYHISHLLNGKLHMSFCDYLNSVRIDAATALLENMELTVTEVGTMVGYNSIRTFNRAFLKQTKQTPREYRAALQNVPNPNR